MIKLWITQNTPVNNLCGTCTFPQTLSNTNLYCGKVENLWKLIHIIPTSTLQVHNEKYKLSTTLVGTTSPTSKEISIKKKRTIGRDDLWVLQ